MATQKTGTTRKKTASKKTEAATTEERFVPSLPGLTNANGTPANTVPGLRRDQYDLIELFHVPEGEEEADQRFIIQSGDEDTEISDISNGMDKMITSLVFNALSGRGTATDGLVIWYGTAVVQQHPELKYLLGDGDNWYLAVETDGNGGAERYEAPLSLWHQISMVRHSLISTSVEKWPSKPKSRKAAERKDTAKVLFLG